MGSNNSRGAARSGQPPRPGHAFLGGEREREGGRGGRGPHDGPKPKPLLCSSSPRLSKRAPQGEGRARARSVHARRRGEIGRECEGGKVRRLCLERRVGGANGLGQGRDQRGRGRRRTTTTRAPPSLPLAALPSLPPPSPLRKHGARARGLLYSPQSDCTRKRIPTQHRYRHQPFGRIQGSIPQRRPARRESLKNVQEDTSSSPSSFSPHPKPSLSSSGFFPPARVRVCVCASRTDHTRVHVREGEGVYHPRPR